MTQQKVYDTIIARREKCVCDRRLRVGEFRESESGADTFGTGNSGA